MLTATRKATALFAIAVVVNFVWEIGQSVLFAPMGSLAQGLWRCLAASAVDAVIVFGIVVVGLLVFRRIDWWLVRPRASGYALIVITGLTIATAIERRALQQGRWAYESGMPIVPGLDVGLLPLLQMAVLPPVIFYATAAWLRRPRPSLLSCSLKRDRGDGP